MKGILEKSWKKLEKMKILFDILQIWGSKYKEPWKIPEKKRIVGKLIGYNTYIRL